MLAMYTLTSAVLFGWALWPHPGRGVVGLADQPDPEVFIWSFAWWAHAIGSWVNPFVTHAIYRPYGANVMWTPSAPGLALVFVPLTLLVGPTASYNAAILLLPALSAWTAYLLCRYLTRSTWASVVGGYLFGFSSYVVTHEYGGHLNLAVFLVPLAALVLVRYVRGDLGGRGLALRLGAVLALQLAISTEVVFTLTLAILLGMAIALVTCPDLRPRLVSAFAPLAASYAVAALLAAPFVVYLLSGFEGAGVVDTGFFDGDLLNIVLPTRLIGAGGSALASFTGHFPGNDNERNLYIGLPALLMVVLYAWPRRRTSGARFLVVSLVTAWILALGSALRIDDRKLIPLPWALVRSLPAFDNVITTRLAVFASLVASVAVALLIASTGARSVGLRYVLPVLALASIVPATWQIAFTKQPLRPAFFTQKLYKLCIPKGETLMVFPFGRFGDSMIYQAESGFWFNLAEGNLGRDRYPPSFVFANRTMEQLQFFWYGPGRRPTMRELYGLAKQFHVDRVASLTGPNVPDYPNTTQMHKFGPLQVLGDVAVAPACGHDSLAGDKRRIPGQ